MKKKHKHILSVINFTGSAMLAVWFIFTMYSICMWGSLYLLIMAVMYRIEMLMEDG